MTLSLLYLGWIPELEPSTTSSWGYDPQRYYQDSRELALSNFTGEPPTLNYQGVIYMYAAVFWLFGCNPVVPVLINTLITLAGVLVVIRALYAFVPTRLESDWCICLILLIPEMVWYDAMTSRETVMATLIVVSAVVPARSVFLKEGVFGNVGAIVVGGLALLAIAAVRTSMTVPVVVSIALLACLAGTNSKTALATRVAMVVLSGVLLLAGPAIQASLGGSEIDYASVMERLSGPDRDLSEFTWSDRSIGLLLVPDGLAEACLFAPLRLLLYLAVPLPAVTVPLNELIAGSYSAWQRAVTLPGSLAMLGCVPLLVGATFSAWQARRSMPTLLIFPVIFWSVAAAVAGGNVIVHDRYRIMFVYLFYACVWAGYRRLPSEWVRSIAAVWVGMLLIAVLAYLGYKGG